MDNSQSWLAVFIHRPRGSILLREITSQQAAEDHSFADNAVWSHGLLPRDKHVMPWRIEDEMKAIGANCVQGGLWRSFAVRDGNLVTGQQNFSGTETACLIIETLGR
jgi:putative intracellular protease/amidase